MDGKRRWPLLRLWCDDSAPTSIEYALLAAGIAVVVLGAVFFFGQTVSDMFQKSGERIGGRR